MSDTKRKGTEDKRDLHRVDLNADLGESFGVYRLGMDEDVLRFVTSANIACGYHAGDHNVMARTVRLAKERGVGIGAHPGLPDLMGFGRRPMRVEPEEVYHMIVYQVGALQAFARVNDAVVRHVKPHGALYNMAAKDRALAEAVAQAVYDLDSRLILFGPSGSVLIEAAERIGLKAAREVFADRGYEADGTLTDRSQPGAVIHDERELVSRAIRMIKEGCVTTSEGRDIPIQADTLCLHGDHPQALQMARRLHAALKDAAVEIRSVE